MKRLISLFKRKPKQEPAITERQKAYQEWNYIVKFMDEHDIDAEKDIRRMVELYHSQHPFEPYRTLHRRMDYLFTRWITEKTESR